MGSRLGSERATVLDNGGKGNADAEKVKAVLMILRQPKDGRLSLAETEDWIDMLGLRAFVNQRRGLAPTFEPCPRCATAMAPANTGRSANGRPYCRCCYRSDRNAHRAGQRATPPAHEQESA